MRKFTMLYIPDIKTHATRYVAIVASSLFTYYPFFPTQNEPFVKLLNTHISTVSKFNYRLALFLLEWEPVWHITCCKHHQKVRLKNTYVSENSNLLTAATEPIHLIRSSPVVTICTNQFNSQQFYVLPTQCVCVFCVDLRTNSDYFPKQR